MKTLSNDDFLTELSAMYGRHQSRTVFVSMKRHFVERADHPGSVEPVCLIRAVANDEKISTIVSQREHVKFQMAYGTVLRSCMTSLHKEAKKRKKGKGGAGAAAGAADDA